MPITRPSKVYALGWGLWFLVGVVNFYAHRAPTTVPPLPQHFHTQITGALWLGLLLMLIAVGAVLAVRYLGTLNGAERE